MNFELERNRIGTTPINQIVAETGKRKQNQRKKFWMQNKTCFVIGGARVLVLQLGRVECVLRRAQTKRKVMKLMWRPKHKKMLRVVEVEQFANAQTAHTHIHCSEFTFAHKQVSDPFGQTKCSHFRAIYWFFVRLTDDFWHGSRCICLVECFQFGLMHSVRMDRAWNSPVDRLELDYVGRVVAFEYWFNICIYCETMYDLRVPQASLVYG